MGEQSERRLEPAIAAYREGRFADAILWLEQRLSDAPGDAEAAVLLGETRLLLGDYDAGLPLYERRWDCGRFDDFRRAFPQPWWPGEPLGRRTLTIGPEQGLGEAIQFCRYALLVAHRNPEAHVVLELHRRLAPLVRHSLQKARRVTVVETLDRAGSNLPPFDLYLPLASLPQRLETRLESIPAAPAYLHAPRPRRLARAEEFAVGISWHSANPQNGQARSLPLPELARVLQQPGVRLVNLQYGDSAPERAALTRREGIALLNAEGVDTEAPLGGLADLVAGCDLVVTIDNTTAHLAGALGRPTWLLLPHAPNWRWLLERPDSPWYPSLRLFRQPARSDWQSVLGELYLAFLDHLDKATQAA